VFSREGGAILLFVGFFASLLQVFTEVSTAKFIVFGTLTGLSVITLVLVGVVVLFSVLNLVAASVVGIGVPGLDAGDGDDGVGSVRMDWFLRAVGEGLCLNREWFKEGGFTDGAEVFPSLLFSFSCGCIEPFADCWLAVSGGLIVIADIAYSYFQIQFESYSFWKWLEKKPMNGKFTNTKRWKKEGVGS
jgi:hypothetical protein